MSHGRRVHAFFIFLNCGGGIQLTFFAVSGLSSQQEALIVSIGEAFPDLGETQRKCSLRSPLIREA
jgi:hypothetical protein